MKTVNIITRAVTLVLAVAAGMAVQHLRDGEMFIRQEKIISGQWEQIENQGIQIGALAAKVEGHDHASDQAIAILQRQLRECEQRTMLNYTNIPGGKAVAK